MFTLEVHKLLPKWQNLGEYNFTEKNLNEIFNCHIVYRKLLIVTILRRTIPAKDSLYKAMQVHKFSVPRMSI